MPPRQIYLDHLIPRENLRYRRAARITEDIETKTDLPSLRITDLIGTHITSWRISLRKPDFQRPTWAWTAEDCASLLDTLVKGQVIPSIIMWSNRESGFDFILDGAHRISVVMAWMLDDWGDLLPTEDYADEQTAAEIKAAGNEVREFVNVKIGSYKSFVAAHDALNVIVMDGGAPRQSMEPAQFEKAQFIRNLQKGLGFHILWVHGNYEIAEKSFLKINKSGKSLDPWETKLIENRNSSFARAVMAIANPEAVEHYWPQVTDAEFQPQDVPSYQIKLSEILTGINELNRNFFEPKKPANFSKLSFPIMEISERYKKPFWIGELLTIYQGFEGMESDTAKLLEQGNDHQPPGIIDSGHALITTATKITEHLIGTSQRSLNVVPLIYFYTSTGKFVRSLFYGFIYWLLSGTDEEILARKRLFAAHRDSFEKVIFDRKEDAATGITRQIGSGPEVTRQTANYYDGLLSILINHKDNIYSDPFRNDYADLVKRVTGKKPPMGDLLVSNSRLFTSKMKAEKLIDTLVKHAPACGICQGAMDLEMSIQHDHTVEYSQGGQTSSENHRLTHPFCNNNANRHEIENIRSGQVNARLPFFSKSTLLGQMNFFDSFQFE